MVLGRPTFTLKDMSTPYRLLALALLSGSLAGALPIAQLPLSADVPDKMLSLTPQGIAQIYPQNNRPAAVFLSADKKVSISLEQRRTPLKPQDIGVLVGQYPAVIKAQVPGLSSLVSRQLTINGVPWAQFVYTLPVKGGERRRETLLGSADGKLLMVNVDSTVNDYNKNQVDVRGFINSLQVQ